MPESVAPLAFVVVNYGSTELLRLNLAKSVAEAQPAFVVVVDNFSTERERSVLRAAAEEFGWTLVEAESNLGFGGGMNLGVRRARELGARDLLLLNPDASIDGPAVQALQEFVSDARTTVVAPRIIDSQGNTWFEGADVYLADGRTAGVKKRSLHPGEERWDWLSGACLLVPVEAWELADGFDEDYFLYWEDVDFSLRVTSSGGHLRVLTDVVAVHDEGGTQRDQTQRAKSATYYYFNIRNRMLFAVKHLDEEDVRRWKRGAWQSAREILLRGGRRQFLRPWPPLSAAWRGVRDGRRLEADSSPGRATR